MTVNSIYFRLKAFLAVLITVIAAGTIGFSLLEGASIIDSLYFSVVTVATVGYGDIHPTSPSGKLLAVVLIITGVGTFLGVIANATELLLARREEESRKERLGMIIGVFYSEIGFSLLKFLVEADPEALKIKNELLVDQDWTDENFDAVCERLQSHSYIIEPDKINMEQLRGFLAKKGSTLLRLLENPNLMEHESFTDLLRAVFHLREELLHRNEFSNSQKADQEHLANDAKRIYRLLVKQWISHLEYLKNSYPYLYSLAVRTNPFSSNATPYIP